MGVSGVYEVVLKYISLLLCSILSHTVKRVCDGAYWK